MALFEIPIPQGVAFFTKRVPLDGTDYLFEFKYNQREDSFYLKILSGDGTHILGPFKIISNYPMFAFHRYAVGLPAGDLWAIAFKNEQASPGMNRLGSDISLVYDDLQEAP